MTSVWNKIFKLGIYAINYPEIIIISIFLRYIIGLIDRSKPLPSGGQIEQAEGVVWMAFFCSVMLDISLELAVSNPQTYETVASKFLDHFISLCDTINGVGGSDNGLWNEEQGFYYDRIRLVKCISHSLSLSLVIIS